MADRPVDGNSAHSYPLYLEELHMNHAAASIILFISANVFLMAACGGKSKHATSTQNSDWEGPEVKDKTRNFVVDWSCQPKRFGVTAETRVIGQEEYCEWQVVKETDDEKVCRFTSSFDKTRDFYLNSRGKTEFNTIGAARYLVDVCAGNALERLQKGKTVGSLCSGVSEGCVAGRNSDPEICSRVRWAVGERYNDKIDFCINNLAAGDEVESSEPLMQFGILTELPENCAFATDDKTEVLCTIPKEDDCFAISGELRLGLRVEVKPRESELTLGAAKQCYVP